MPNSDSNSTRVSRRRRVEEATANEVQQCLTARKIQQQSSGATPLATLPSSCGNSDDEDMYAESQMVVYDRSSGTTAAGSNVNSNISMPPPAHQQSSLKSAALTSPGTRQTRRSTRRISDHARVAGHDHATATEASAGDLSNFSDTAPRVLMIS